MPLIAGEELWRAYERLGSITHVDAPSPESTSSEETGPKPIDDYELVLGEAWAAPFMTKSNFARDHADTVAASASQGWLTVQEKPDAFGRFWKVTPTGLEHLWFLREMM